MPVTMTKADIAKLLAAERKKSRTKQKQSAFMNKTRNIYSGQTIRLREASGDEAAVLPYTLEQLRTVVAQGLERPCCYCHGKLTIKRLTPDHKASIASGGSWDLANLAMCCQSCQWQKGRLSDVEFRRLLRFCAKYLTPDSATDLKRRLSVGGKWSPR